MRFLEFPQLVAVVIAIHSRNGIGVFIDIEATLFELMALTGLQRRFNNSDAMQLIARVILVGVAFGQNVFHLVSG